MLLYQLSYSGKRRTLICGHPDDPSRADIAGETEPLPSRALLRIPSHSNGPTCFLLRVGRHRVRDGLADTPGLEPGTTRLTVAGSTN